MAGGMPRSYRAFWGNSKFSFGAATATIYTLTIDDLGTVTEESSVTETNYVYGAWADDNFVYVAGGDVGLKVFSINPITGALTFTDAYGASGPNDDVLGV